MLCRCERVASVDRWISCLPAMLQACAESRDETSADDVLTVMLHVGSRQSRSFLAQFDENIVQFLGECVVQFYLS